jgi:hypothetical protein
MVIDVLIVLSLIDPVEETEFVCGALVQVLQLWIFGCRTGPSFPFTGILSTDFKVLQALSRPSSWFTGMLTMLGRKLQCFYVSC